MTEYSGKRKRVPFNSINPTQSQRTQESTERLLTETRKQTTTGETRGTHDPVNHPTHYCSHPSGVEAIIVTEHMNFCIGNAIKYLWRADEKWNDIEDLEKAQWYLTREINRRKGNDKGRNK